MLLPSARSTAFAACLLVAALVSPIASAELPLIMTVAGGGPNGLPAVQSSINRPQGVAVNAKGDLFISTYVDRRVLVRKASTGNLYVAAGTGVTGCSGEGGPAVEASISSPNGLAVDRKGDLFIADGGCNRVWRVDAHTGIISVYAGDGRPLFAGDGGPAIHASLIPLVVALDANDNLFVGDAVGERIRRIDSRTGAISTVAGNGYTGFGGDGGPATDASFEYLSGVTVDTKGDLFIAELGSNRIRHVEAATGRISTLVQVYGPFDVVFTGAGQLYVSSGGDEVVRVDSKTGLVSDVAGNPGICHSIDDDVPALSTCLRDARRVAVSRSGDLFIAEAYYHRVRRVDATSGHIITVAGNRLPLFSGDGRAAVGASLGYPWSVKSDSDGNLFIADSLNDRIRRVDAISGTITTVAGGATGVTCFDEGIPATDSCLKQPRDILLDGSGTLILSDTGFGRVRRVDAVTGVVTTVAGGGVDWDENVPAVSAWLQSPWGLTFGPDGSLFIVESVANGRVRRVDASDGTISTVAGAAFGTLPGDGGPALAATIPFPLSVAVDLNRNLYIGSWSRVRVVEDLSGNIWPYAGGGSGLDGGPATDASCVGAGLAFDADGNLLIADSRNNEIRRVDGATHIIDSLVGSGVYDFGGDGGPADSAELAKPQGLDFNPQGELLIADTDSRRIRKIIDPQSFSLADPPRGVAFAAPMIPPTFRWSTAGLSTFRVEFSNDSVAFKHPIVSSKKLQPQTSYTPTKQKWNQILNLAKGGKTVYWRVAGQASGSTAIVPSDQVFSFTYEP